MVIDGKKIAEEIIAELKNRSASWRTEKFFAAVLVGDDAASASFLKQKERVARELGVDFRLHRFPSDVTQDALRKEVLAIAQHKACGGVIVQLPLPALIDRYHVLNAIPPEKDVDVLGERALGAFYTGRNPVLPPAVGTVRKILQTLKRQPQGKKAVVIGRGLLVGRPVALWLMGEVAELTVLNSTTRNLRGKLRDADMIVSGVGKAGLFSAEDVRDGALVVDFGYARGPDGKICGDFTPPLSVIDYKSSAYTPTPGGTGPVLVAQLFENFYRLVARQ